MTDPQRILINNCFGGFAMSDAALHWLIDNKGWSIASYSEIQARTSRGDTFNYTFSDTMQVFSHKDVFNDRTDDDILDCFDALGTEQFSGNYSLVAAVDVPADVKWSIEDYDGNEHIAEVHRTWY